MPYPVYAEDRMSPQGEPLAITPHNSTAIVGGPIYGLYVGVGGDITVITNRANTVLFKAVPQGMILPLPMGVTHVKATGTTATDMVGFSQPV
jgi:hypothetical protein